MAFLEAVTLGMLIARGITTVAETARGLKEIKQAKDELWWSKSGKGKLPKEVQQSLANARTADIVWVQESLNALGYGPLDVDGIDGEATMLAVLNFQRERGLHPDGVPGVLTVSAIINTLRELHAIALRAAEIQE